MTMASTKSTSNLLDFFRWMEELDVGQVTRNIFLTAKHFFDLGNGPVLKALDTALQPYGMVSAKS
jgi:hypothetical protein